MQRYVKNYEVEAEEIVSEDGIDIGGSHFDKGDYIMVEHGVLQGITRAEWGKLGLVKAKKAYKSGGGRKKKGADQPPAQTAQPAQATA